MDKKIRYISQRNRLESSETEPHLHGKLFNTRVLGSALFSMKVSSQLPEINVHSYLMHRGIVDLTMKSQMV